MRLVLGAALVVLLALPVASACSLVAPGPPLPARLWVWDLEEGREVDRVDLWSRGLDADCGLLLAHDLDGNRLVYADRAGDSQGVWLRVLGDPAPPRLVFRLDGMYQDLDLHDDLLSIYLETRQRGDSLPVGHLFTVNLTTGQASRADLAPDWLGRPFVAEGVAYWSWVNRSEYLPRFNAYDLAAGRWLEQNVSYAQFGLGETARVMTANRDWILLSTDDGNHAYHWPTRALTALPTFEGQPRLDGDRLLLQQERGGSLSTMQLPNGTFTTIPLPSRPFFRDSVVNGDQGTFGVYSLPVGEREAMSPPPWITNPPLREDHPLPEALRHQSGPEGEFSIPGFSAAVAVVAVAAALVRRRSGGGTA